MLYAISIWNFVDENNDIIDAINFFVDNGYNAISLRPDNIIKTDRAKLARIKSIIKERDIPVTIHANYDITVDTLEIIFRELGSSLKSISLDPICKIDQNAHFFGSLNIIPILSYLNEKTKENNVLFGLEDFPLDDNALKNNLKDLSKIIECPRYGILLDIGHSNLRTTDNEYFKAKGIEKYLTDIPVPIIELHVHDNKKTGDWHMPPGQGNLDFALVAKTLNKKMFNQISTIEIAPTRYNSKPENEREAAIYGLRHWKNHLERNNEAIRTKHH